MNALKIPEMPFFKPRLLLQVITLMFLTNSVFALNLESAKEQACFPINKTAEVDINWMISVKEWYYPLMSRLDLYLSSLELTGNIETPLKLQESEVYYDSCITAEIVGNNLHLSGFNGKQIRWALGPPTVTDAGATYQKLTLDSGSGGVAYTTLTDNSTFSVLVVCWDDNQTTWGVISTVPTLSKESVDLVHAHAVSLGFKMEYFEEIRYSYCNDGRKNFRNVKDNGKGVI